MSYEFPSQSMITALADQHAFDAKRFITMDILPVDGENFNQSPAKVMWDVISPAKGLTSLSALDASPSLIDQRAITTKTADPLIFRDAVRIGEAQLVNMRHPGTSTERDGDRMVYRAIDQLNTRLDSLIEATNFMALTGTISIGGQTIDTGLVSAQKPNVSTTAGYGGEYWNDPDATIKADIYKAMEVLEGKGCSDFVMLADWSVYAKMATNEAFMTALYGSPEAKEVGARGLAMRLPDYLGCGITEARISTSSYIADNGNTTPFAPKNKLFIVGRPADGQLGVWASTPSTYNQGKGGRYMVISDHSADELVPHVDVMGGIHGLPVLYQPACVVCMQVLA